MAARSAAEQMAVAPAGEKIDPLNVNYRLYSQVSKLLDQLELGGGAITMRERIAALQAIGRIQIIFLNLRKEKIGDNTYAGSAVKKYSEAFKTDDPRRRGEVARSEPDDDEPDTIDPDTWGDDDDDDERDTA